MHGIPLDYLAISLSLQFIKTWFTLVTGHIHIHIIQIVLTAGQQNILGMYSLQGRYNVNPDHLYNWTYTHTHVWLAAHEVYVHIYVTHLNGTS